MLFRPCVPIAWRLCRRLNVVLTRVYAFRTGRPLTQAVLTTDDGSRLIPYIAER